MMVTSVILQLLVVWFSIRRREKFETVKITIISFFGRKNDENDDGDEDDNNNDHLLRISAVSSSSYSSWR